MYLVQFRSHKLARSALPSPSPLHLPHPHSSRPHAHRHLSRSVVLPFSAPPSHSRLTFTDHKPFLSDSFDVHSYTNAILQGRQYTPDQSQQNNNKEDNDKADLDVGAELARLNYGIVRFHARHFAMIEQLTGLIGRCDKAATAGGRLPE